MMKKSNLAPVAITVSAVTVATVAAYHYAKSRDFWVPQGWVPQGEPEMASFVTLATSGMLLHLPDATTGEEKEVLRFELPDSGSIKIARLST
jgi:hypothetical protein